MNENMNKENCGGKSCGWIGDECTCNLGWDDTKTNNEWEKEFDTFWYDKFAQHEEPWKSTAANSNCYWYASPNDIKSFIHSLLSSERQRLRELEDGKLLDQLYRLEGVLGKYNCQQGGTKCEFQTNCHRLIREEIEKLKFLEE